MIPRHFQGEHVVIVAAVVAIVVSIGSLIVYFVRRHPACAWIRSILPASIATFADDASARSDSEPAINRRLFVVIPLVVSLGALLIAVLCVVTYCTMRSHVTTTQALLSSNIRQIAIYRDLSGPRGRPVSSTDLIIVVQSDSKAIAAFTDALRDVADVATSREILSDGYIVRVFSENAGEFVDLGLYQHSSVRGRVSVVTVYYANGKNILATYSGTQVETWIANQVNTDNN